MKSLGFFQNNSLPPPQSLHHPENEFGCGGGADAGGGPVVKTGGGGGACYCYWRCCGSGQIQVPEFKEGMGRELREGTGKAMLQKHRR